MPRLSDNLELDRCPHCSVANPNLWKQYQLETRDHAGERLRRWCVYVCRRCGGVVTAWAPNFNEAALEHFPATRSIEHEIPAKPRAFLQQAHESMHAPAGAVMLAASAVDSMLKLKGYSEGSLYTRINKAANDHLITSGMAEWAHQVRLDANDQRHADDGAELPTQQDAERVIDFTTALAQFLFVLPSRVERGLHPPQG